jgi:hypothetical protein
MTLPTTVYAQNPQLQAQHPVYIHHMTTIHSKDNELLHIHEMTMTITEQALACSSKPVLPAVITVVAQKTEQHVSTRCCCNAKSPTHDKHMPHCWLASAQYHCHNVTAACTRWCSAVLAAAWPISPDP